MGGNLGSIAQFLATMAGLPSLIGFFAGWGVGTWLFNEEECAYIASQQIPYELGGFTYYSTRCLAEACTNRFGSNVFGLMNQPEGRVLLLGLAMLLFTVAGVVINQVFFSVE